MGKRKKAAKKPGGKKKEKLATVFSCLFCNHENCVVIDLVRKEGRAELECKVCAQKYKCPINYLSAAVDVYSDWIDACDAVAKGHGVGEVYMKAGVPSPLEPRQRISSKSKAKAKAEAAGADEDEDDDIMDDEDGMGGYGGRDEGIVPDDEDDY